MKIPGYKHLIEDVLPDLNNYLDLIRMKVFRSSGKFGTRGSVFHGVLDGGILEFEFTEGNITRYDFVSLYQSKHQELLKTIISWYLWSKYAYKNDEYVYTEMHPGDNEILVGWDYLDETGKKIHVESLVSGYAHHGSSMTELSILDPVNVASWKLLVKRKRRK